MENTEDTKQPCSACGKKNAHLVVDGDQRICKEYCSLLQSLREIAAADDNVPKCSFCKDDKTKLITRTMVLTQSKKGQTVLVSAKKEVSICENCIGRFRFAFSGESSGDGIIH
jgi:hypothetical protein